MRGGTEGGRGRGRTLVCTSALSKSIFHRFLKSITNRTPVPSVVPSPSPLSSPLQSPSFRGRPLRPLQRTHNPRTRAGARGGARASQRASEGFSRGQGGRTRNLWISTSRRGAAIVESPTMALTDRIIDALGAHPDGLSTRALQRELGVRGGELRRALRKLREAGSVASSAGRADQAAVIHRLSV